MNAEVLIYIGSALPVLWGPAFLLHTQTFNPFIFVKCYFQPLIVNIGSIQESLFVGGTNNSLLLDLAFAVAEKPFYFIDILTLFWYNYIKLDNFLLGQNNSMRFEIKFDQLPERWKVMEVGFSGKSYCEYLDDLREV